MHQVLADLDRVIVLDTDVFIACDLHSLWAHFSRFHGAIVGLAPETAPSYTSEVSIRKG